VKARVERYKSDLEGRGQDPANAMLVLRHLAKLPKLANQLVTASTLSDDLSKFRDHLAAKGLKPATIDRTNCALKATLNLAADFLRSGKRSRAERFSSFAERFVVP
jgi:hypothetical protein